MPPRAAFPRARRALPGLALGLLLVAGCSPEPIADPASADGPPKVTNNPEPTKQAPAKLDIQ